MIRELLHKIEIDLQKLFGLTMFVNYIAYFFIFDNDSIHTHLSLIFRGIASFMCLSLLFIKHDHNLLIKRLYWYATVTYCLPFFFTFMSLANNLSTIWLMNSVSAAFFMIILLRLRLFFILLALGISFAIILYKYMFGSTILIIPGEVTISNLVATYVAVLIIGSLFSFNRELIEKERKESTDKIAELNHSLEQKILDRTIELREALSAKTEFLNNMSHEIRTPIHGLTAISEGLTEHWMSLEEDKKKLYVEQISIDAKRLEKLLLNLLDLSKFTSEKITMKAKKTDLVDIIKNIIDEYKSLAEIKFIGPKSAIIIADAGLLTQAINNLFSNAIKFSLNNNPILTELVLTKDNQWHFSITDSGVGIPEAELENIFDAFTQSSRTKTGAGGTGLGLSISKRIIIAHGGAIWAKNNSQHGASFHFQVAAA